MLFRPQQRSVAAALLLTPFLDATPSAAQDAVAGSTLAFSAPGLLSCAALFFVALAIGLAARAPRVSEASDRTTLTWLGVGCFAAALALVLAASNVSSSTQPVSFIPLSDSGAQVLRLVVSALLVAHILLATYLAKTNRSELWESARSRTLLLLAGLSLAGYCNWGAMHFGSFVHRHELLHYFLGAKNAPELRYTRLYDCTLQALREDRPEWLNIQEQRVQDLVNNQIVFAYQLEERMRDCPTHFSPERWQQFKSDVVALRASTDLGMWNASLIDYGYNPPPTWNVVPGALVRNLALNDTNLTLIALIDPLLVAAGLAAVWWAFGLEIACYAACIFGLTFSARFYWTGGGFMRQDWLACLLVGLSMLRRNFFLCGGFLLGCSALLRIFPLCFLFAPLMLGAIGAIRERRIDRGWLRLVLGALLAGAMLIPLGAWSMGGYSAYGEFAQNSAKHLSSPFSNNMGFPSVVSFRAAPEVSEEILRGDDFQQLEAYKAIRRAAFEERKPLFIVATLGFLAFLLWCLKAEKRPWILATFGFAVIPVATQLACYYYSFLMVAAFLLREEPRIVVILVITTFVGQALGLALGQGELLYTALSILAIYLATESALTYRLKLQGPPD